MAARRGDLRKTRKFRRGASTPKPHSTATKVKLLNHKPRRKQTTNDSSQAEGHTGITIINPVINLYVGGAGSEEKHDSVHATEQWNASPKEGLHGCSGTFGKKSIEPFIQGSAAFVVFAFTCYALYQIICGRYAWTASTAFEFLVFVTIFRETNLFVVRILLDCTIICTISGLVLTGLHYCS